MNKISTLFAQAQGQEVDIPDQFGQGRATLGGLVGGILFAHLHQAVGIDKPPRSVTVSFVGPVESGVKAQLSAEIFRQGKSVTHGQAKLLQDGQVKATLLGSFGGDRTSNVACSAVEPPPSKSPEEALKLPYIPGVVPEFIQQFDIRIGSGDMPYSGGAPDFSGYMRFGEPWQEGDFSLAHLVTLVDVWPPSIIPVLKAPAPVSSLAWTMEFIQPLSDETIRTLWHYAVKTDFAAAGYSHSRANIWNERGELMVISRQTVTVFDQ